MVFCARKNRDSPSNSGLSQSLGPDALHQLIGDNKIREKKYTCLTKILNARYTTP